MKIILVIVHTIRLDVSIINTNGRINAISTSNTRKMIAIKKNCKENGSREDDDGSNPHSNGDDFSRSIRVFFDNIEAIIITTIEIVMIRVAVNIIE